MINLVRSIDPTAKESIHLCSFPEYDEKLIDKELEARMDEVLDVVTLGRNARNSANIKNRQPIGKIYVNAKDLPTYFKEIIENELNVKEVIFTENVSEFTSYTFKPNFKTLGPKYGKQLGQIQGALQKVDGSAFYGELVNNGKVVLALQDQEIELAKEDLLIEVKQKEGYETASDKGITVVLDTTLTSELLEEGMVRELISKVQTMRKDAGFEVVDHIILTVSGNEKVENIVSKNIDTIKADVLADEVNYTLEEGFTKSWNLNGEEVTLSVKKK